MGNYSSSMKSNKSTETAEKNFNNFYEIVDYIATYYILTMDFQSLRRLSEREYCDNLIILTSDIINKYFNNMDITYLAQRVANGVEINELSKENVSFINQSKLHELDISNDKQKMIKKKRVCIGIAKFYVKIAHIFAAIVMTINPVYMYKDPQGNIIKNNLMEKNKIPKNVKRRVLKLNICDNRIRALNRGENLNNIQGDNATVHPKVCDFNTTKMGDTKTLADEPGIKELMKLYLDDNYDYSTGVFTGMSKTTEKQFINDLKTFYTAFTGNKDMPPEIKKFSDIKLRDYNSMNGCQKDNPHFKNPYTMNKNDKLFTDYATNINSMINSASSKQSELLDVINTLFTYVIDPYTGRKKIRVNPKLTDDSLQKEIENTRKIIIQLYVQCETDYLKGIKLYEAIVESKILQTTQNQINNLEKESTKIIEDTVTKIKPQQIQVRPPNPVPNPAPLPNIDNIQNENPQNIKPPLPLQFQQSPNNMNLNEPIQNVSVRVGQI